MWTWKQLRWWRSFWFVCSCMWMLRPRGEAIMEKNLRKLDLVISGGKPESRSGVFGGRPMKLPWSRSGPIKGSLGKVPAVKTCTNGPGLIKLSSYSGSTPFIFSKGMNPDNWLDYLDLGYRVKKLAFQHAEVINSISCSMLMKHLYLIRHACIK